MLLNQRLTKKAVMACACGFASLALAAGQAPAKAGVFDDVEDSNSAQQAPAVSVSPFGQIDLHVKDVDLSKVLQLLSIQAQRNIVASRNVAGKVSADLYGVDFYEALDAILHPNGFGYQEKGSFIYVYTQQELAAIQDAERVMTTKVVRLSYITAVDASTFVSPLLSPTGSIAVSGSAPAGFEASSGDGGANSFAHADTLVIRDYPENVEQIVKTIEELDVRPKQVLVEATILEANLTEANALGVDLSVLVNFDQLATGAGGIGGVDKLLSGTVVGAGNGGATGGSTTSVGNTAAGKSGMKIGIVDDNFSIFIRALDQVTDATVVANPKLLVLNRQRAKLLVGQKLGYLSTTQNENTTTQTVEFLDVGTELSVRPFVGDDDFIRLEIKPAISTGTVEDVAGFVIPTKNTEELTTNVMLRNGQTAVLGGLFKETTTVTRKQVPFLGDVPVLGAAFRGQDDDSVRSEFIFLLTPSIVKDQALYAAGERAKESVHMVQVGAREGLLPWSRTKLQAGELREASKQLEAGNNKKALWAVNNALSLEPSSAEAHRLKAQITGQQEQLRGGSILDDAVKQMIDQKVESGADATQTPETPAATETSQAPETTEVQADAESAEVTTETPVADQTAAVETEQTAVETPATEAPAQEQAQVTEQPVIEPTASAEPTADVEQAAVEPVTEQPAEAQVAVEQPVEASSDFVQPVEVEVAVADQQPTTQPTTQPAEQTAMEQSWVNDQPQVAAETESAATTQPTAAVDETSVYWENMPQEQPVAQTETEQVTNSAAEGPPVIDVRKALDGWIEEQNQNSPSANAESDDEMNDQ